MVASIMIPLRRDGSRRRAGTNGRAGKASRRSFASSGTKARSLVRNVVQRDEGSEMHINTGMADSLKRWAVAVRACARPQVSSRAESGIWNANPEEAEAAKSNEGLARWILRFRLPPFRARQLVPEKMLSSPRH